MKATEFLFGGRARREEELERVIFDAFVGAGVAVWRQVRCGAWGRADLLTKDAVYEAKDVLTRRTFYEALGQLQCYSNYLNPDARRVIVCNRSKVPQLHEVAKDNGIDVLVMSPPYAAPAAHFSAHGLKKGATPRDLLKHLGLYLRGTRPPETP
jgi:hypothetical protein